MSKGGTDSIFNLVWSCGKCNVKKRNKLLNFEADSQPANEVDYPVLSVKKLARALLYLIVAYFVPPVPEYRQEKWKDFWGYFIYVVVCRQDKIYTWLHDNLWIVSDEVKAVIKQAERYNERELEIKSKSFTDIAQANCPECQCGIGITTGLKWMCPAGHYGNVHPMNIALHNELKSISDYTYKDLHNGIPEWLDCIDKSKC